MRASRHLIHIAGGDTPLIGAQNLDDLCDKRDLVGPALNRIARVSRFDPIDAGIGELALRFEREVVPKRIAETATVGTATITVKGTSGSLTASTTIVLTVSCTPTTIIPYISINGGLTWTQESTATVNSPSAVMDLGPQPTSGGSWSWTGPNKYTSTSRQINSVPLTMGTDLYLATYTNTGGCKSTQTFTITVK